MSTETRCLKCFSGNVINGVCDRCRNTAETPETRSATALPSGFFLHGRYTVGEVLGSGGFGITYAAWDNQEQHRVALKELFPSQDMAREPDRCSVRVVPGQEDYIKHVSQCFINEANILMQLQGQRGVVSIYNLFNANNTLYYTMEFLEGTDLKTYILRNGRLTWRELGPMLKAVLEALDVLHSKNLIHRDISPDNIFITSRGAQLIDFGSVRMYQGTKSFTTFMKQSFAPWEQYQSNGPQGPWTDIYALSVTAYYVLSGVLPPKAPDRKLQDTLVPIWTLCPELPGNVAAAIHKGMAMNIQDRYAGVAELMAALFPEDRNRRPAARYELSCITGFYRGRRWTLTGGSMTLGRQPQCEIRFPEDYRQISRMHCSLTMSTSGELILRDEGSRNGTWLNNVRLPAGKWYAVPRGSVILAAQDEFYVT